MLSFSKKFPASLRSRASQIHAKAVWGARASITHDNAAFSSYTEKASLIERLASDPRMDVVWTEVTKRVRSGYQPTAKYFHPARPPKHASLATQPQPIALEELFCWIILAVECSQLLAPADDVPVADLLLKEADRLRGTDSRRNRSKADQLSKAAAICASIKKLDPAREVVIDLITYLEKHFGNAMYGATSIIASVALDRKITKKMVRESRSVTKSGQNDQNRAYS
jgi:hypothetical protein